jgi:hypothetical protein
LAIRRLSTYTAQNITVSTFSDASQELFELLLVHPNLTQLVITPKQLIFTQFVFVTEDNKQVAVEDKAIIVKTSTPIDRFDLIAFLATPRIPYFGAEEWLYNLLDRYPKSLGVFRDSPRDVKVITERSRAV